MNLLLATNNDKKFIEINELLSPLGVTVKKPNDIGIKFEVEETGLTFRENAHLKSTYLYEKTGMPCLADDSGICVNALGGRPGVFSARYGTPDLNDRGRAVYLLNELGANPDRRAYYVCCLSYTISSETVYIEEECHGVIHTEYDNEGKFGFGYDPIFFFPPLNTLFSKIPLLEKNKVSHRGKALLKFYNHLQNQR